MKEVIIDPVRKLHVDNYKNPEFVSTVATTFWLFNLLYGIGFSLIAGPMLIEQLLPAWAAGNAPWHHLVVIAAAIAVPVVACVFAGLTGLAWDETRLAEFLVGVEFPVASVLVGRSLWAHELTFTSITLYGIMLSIAICQCWLLAHRKVAGMRLHGPPSLVKTAASSFVAIGGVYLSALALVFTSPITVGLLVLGVYMIGGGLAFTLFFPPALLMVPFGVLALVGGVIALRLAFYIPYSFISQWSTRLARTGGFSHRLISAAVILVCCTAFLALHYHVRPQTFNLLSETAVSDSRQSELLAKADTIREELLDAYLAPIRYLPQNFGFNAYHPLIRIRNDLLSLLLPSLVYQGNIDRDHMLADLYYEAFFDAPVQRAEREAILSATKNHWTPNRQWTAGLLDIGQHTVHVESQKLNIEVARGVATVTVQEALRNRTRRRLETLQYFTLPEDAVITGLWLSDTEADPELFAFQVAPRGAAQQVYKEQVQMRVDPALLELVGPRQYRLRVFPVLPDSPMVVTMTYKTLPDSQGYLSLPLLSEQRNIFWDENTVRTVNGTQVKVEHTEHWLPRQLASSNRMPSAPHLGYVSDGRYIYANPLPVSAPLSDQGRVAVLIDGSYSVGNHVPALLSSMVSVSGADLFFCQSECLPANIESAESWVFFGNSQPLQQLQAFQAIAEHRDYKAVLMLSDGGSYEVQGNARAVVSSNALGIDQKVQLHAPTWLVELGQGAQAYRDSLTDSISESGGRIVSTIDQALLAVQLASYTDSQISNTADNLLAITARHMWFEREVAEGDSSNPELAELMASLRIKKLSQSDGSLGALDALHDIAIQYGIVSAYSSMIVLVNDAQRQRLETLSSGEDRYNREVETGKRPVRRVANSVPEPHEWALMCIGFLLLLITAYRQGWTLGNVLPYRAGTDTVILKQL